MADDAAPPGEPWKLYQKQPTAPSSPPAAPAAGPWTRYQQPSSDHPTIYGGGEDKEQAAARARASSFQGFASGVKHGFTDLFYGGAQLGARMGPEEGGAAFADPAELEKRKQTVDTTVAKRETEYQADPAVQAHPGWAYAGDIGGQVAASAPLFALPGAAATMPARAIGAAIPGGVVAAAEPVTSPGDKPGEFKAPDDYGSQKALQVAGGVAGAAIGQPVGEYIGAGVSKVARGVKWLFQTEEQRAASKAARDAEKLAIEQGETPGQKAEAQRKVEKAAATATRSGRLVPGDVIKTMTEAQQRGQPLGLVDVDRSHGPLQRLGGSVVRGPGDAGGFLEDWQFGRSLEKDPETQRNWQQRRLVENVNDLISDKDAAQVAEHGIEERAREGRPLWDRAIAGGSTAPLEHQYGQEFARATEREAAAAQKLREANSRLVAAQSHQQTSAAAQREAATTPSQVRAKEIAEAGKEAVTGVPPAEPKPSGFNEAEHAAARDQAAAEQELKQARADKEATRARLKTSQQDAAENVPGAVWSPHMERMLGDRHAMEGLRVGYDMVRTEANARNIPFDPREWAIKGFDADGNPIVGRVWNMRLIQMAKEGLDAMLEGDQYRDKLTRKLTKPGRAIDELRRNLLAEGDRLRPEWADARQHWAGKSAELEALRDGQVAMHPDKEWSFGDFAKRWNEMKSDGEREMFMIGIAADLRRDIDTSRMTGDTSKATINNPEAWQKLRHMFGPTPEGQEAFQRFEKFVTSERTMWETGINLFRGSQTAARFAGDDEAKREAAIEAGKHAWRAMVMMKVGHPVEAGKSLLSAVSHMGWAHDKGVNLQIAKILADPKPNLSIGSRGELRVGPRITTPSAPAGNIGGAGRLSRTVLGATESGNTWPLVKGMARGTGRGVGGDLGAIMRTGPESMF